MQLYSTSYKNLFRIVSGTITVNNDDSILYCNTSSGAVVINLIDIPTNYWSLQYKLYVVDNSNNAATNNITINAPSGFTINGSSSFVLSTNGESCIVTISSNTNYIIQSSITSGASINFEGTNWSFVYGNGSHTANATELQNAFTSAKTKTPNGSALSATNRFTIIVGSGYYTFASNFLVDANFIDIVSLTGNTDVIFNGAGTIVVSTTNTFLKGIDVTTKNFTLTDGSALNNTIICENCKGGNGSFGENVDISGTFINCVGGQYSFGGNTLGSASGVFTNCTGGTGSFGGFGGIAGGVFNNCVGGQYSFGGGGGTADGTFTNCTGTNYSFGTSGTASGVFKYCKGINESFGGGSGGTASGTFISCEAGSGAFGEIASAPSVFTDCIGLDDCFGGGDNGGNIAAGTFTNCIAGANSFGGGDNNGGTASGTFINCKGGNGSFGGGDTGVGSGLFFNCLGGDESFGNTTCSGAFNNCQAGNGSFGNNSNLSGVLTGKLYYCRLTSGLFQTVSGGGRTIYCIDGSNNTNNQ